MMEGVNLTKIYYNTVYPQDNKMITKKPKFKTKQNIKRTCKCMEAPLGHR
jgi:hypothetical protein